MAMQFPITVFNFQRKINTNFHNFELQNHHHRTRTKKTKSKPHKTFLYITVIKQLASGNHIISIIYKLKSMKFNQTDHIIIKFTKLKFMNN